MPRLTISLSDERHRALKEAAAKRNKTISELIERSLDAFGIKTHQDALGLVARARAKSRLNEADALDLAVEETQALRNK